MLPLPHTPSLPPPLQALVGVYLDGGREGGRDRRGREFSEAQNFAYCSFVLTLEVQILFQGRTYFVLLESQDH